MPDATMHHAPTPFSDAVVAEGDQAILSRLRDTARLIERMLHDDRRQRYFDALSLKRSGGLSGNVTALFFAEPSGSILPEA